MPAKKLKSRNFRPHRTQINSLFAEFLLPNNKITVWKTVYSAITFCAKILTKLSGSGKGITISFDAELLNQRIIWMKYGYLNNQGVKSAKLRDQLERRLKDQN